MPQLLITGGAGFIGSHSCLSFLEAGHNLVILDNYSNGSKEALKRVAQLVGLHDSKRLRLIRGDIRNKNDLDKAFTASDQPIEAVIHFAGLKAVSESFLDPLKYWDVNLSGSRSLLEAMLSYECKTIVFSSSATIYGCPQKIPIDETALVQPVNPYGHTKAAVERLLSDLAESQNGWRIASLRYFNPVGAHSSGVIGEDPNGLPNNLFPVVSQVAVGRIEELKVFGCDWSTPDGSAIRDFIHVVDLAEGHLAALEVLLREPPQMLTLNLGTGRGHSVLEVLNAFQKVSKRNIPYLIERRRPGDVACTVADSTMAEQRLGWKTKLNLFDMCKDAWNWQKMNPLGYQEK